MDIIKDLIYELNDKYFETIKVVSNKIVKFRVISNNLVTKEIYLEKVYDYIDLVCLLNKLDVNKNEYIKLYVDTLYNCLNIKTIKDSRADKYYCKFKKLKESISKNNCKDIDDLRDYTRLFNCLYLEGLKDKEVKDFDFSISYERLSISNNEFIKSPKKEIIAFGKNVNNPSSKILFSYFINNLIYLSMLSKMEGDK